MTKFPTVTESINLVVLCICNCVHFLEKEKWEEEWEEKRKKERKRFNC